jgi:hypothetical protein
VFFDKCLENVYGFEQRDIKMGSVNSKWNSDNVRKILASKNVKVSQTEAEKIVQKVTARLNPTPGLSSIIGSLFRSGLTNSSSLSAQRKERFPNSKKTTLEDIIRAIMMELVREGHVPEGDPDLRDIAMVLAVLQLEEESESVEL